MKDSAQGANSVEETAQILGALPLFGKLDPASLAAIAAHSAVAHFRAGDAIMRQGRVSTFADVILDGEVDVFVDTPAGQARVATVGRHQIVGEVGAIAAMPRTATVIARTELSVLRIRRGSLINLTADHPAIAAAIVGELGRRLYGMNRSLAYLTYAANALGRDEYDPAILAELTRQPGELAEFARAFAHMAAEIEAKQRRRDEIHAAAEIQQSILPRPLAREGALAAIDLHAEMHPAREIGGDFYDFFAVGHDCLAVTVADVSGKGIPAALFMAVSRTVLRSIEGSGENTADDMTVRIERANCLLSADNATAMFVTAFHGVLDLKTGAMRYCNAGHNPPYLLRSDGASERLPATGVPFGVDGDLPYRLAEAQLRPGDTLFLYSDGITEAFNPNGEEFGAARLESALAAARGQSAAGMVARVLAATAEFAAGAEQSDDITALALAYRP